MADCQATTSPVPGFGAWPSIVDRSCKIHAPSRQSGDPADLATKASAIFQEAEALCAKGEFKSALKKYEEAITANNDAIKAYKRVKDDKSAQNLKEKLASVKETRDACKKKMKEAEAAEKERKRQKDSEGSDSADGHSPGA